MGRKSSARALVCALVMLLAAAWLFCFFTSAAEDSTVYLYNADPTEDFTVDGEASEPEWDRAELVEGFSLNADMPFIEYASLKLCRSNQTLYVLLFVNDTRAYTAPGERSEILLTELYEGGSTPKKAEVPFYAGGLQGTAVCAAVKYFSYNCSTRTEMAMTLKTPLDAGKPLTLLISLSLSGKTAVYKRVDILLGSPETTSAQGGRESVTEKASAPAKTATTKTTTEKHTTTKAAKAEKSTAQKTSKSASGGVPVTKPPYDRTPAAAVQDDSVTQTAAVATSPAPAFAAAPAPDGDKLRSALLIGGTCVICAGIAAIIKMRKSGAGHGAADKGGEKPGADIDSPEDK